MNYRRIALTAAAVALTAVGVVGPTQSASANPGAAAVQGATKFAAAAPKIRLNTANDCLEGYVCLFLHEDWQGGGWGYFGDVWNIGADFNDQASSVWNRGVGNSYANVIIYTEADHAGQNQLVRKGEYLRSLRFPNEGRDLNDRISSLKWVN